MKYGKIVIKLLVCIIICNCLNADASNKDGKNTSIVIADRNGKHAVIVIPDNANKVEKYAAGELQYHIKESTGITLPIVKEEKKPQGKGVIYLGACKKTAEAGIKMNNFEPNTGIVKTVDGDLFIAGDSSHRVFGSDKNKGPWQTYVIPTRVGTLFAVYEFLQKQLAVKWLWPGKSGEVIPKRNEIHIGHLDIIWKPHFIHTRLVDNPYRVNVFHSAVWSSPKALEEYLYKQAVWLRRQRFAIGKSMELNHSFKDYWRRFGKTEPELFNLLPDGTRRSDPTIYRGHPANVSMCVSQPALWQKIVKNWERTRTPGDPFIKVGENDNPGKCTCTNCMAWDVADPATRGIIVKKISELGDDVMDSVQGRDDRDLNQVIFNERLSLAQKAFAKSDPTWFQFLGSLSDRYAKFYLAVQKEAEKNNPDATVLGFAYSNYASAPVQTRLNKRIGIVFVPNFIFPWSDNKRLETRNRWTGWSSAGASVILRPNWLLAGHNMPLFYARKLGEEFNYYAANNMIATDFDSLTGQWSTQGPNLYVLARLHNEPGRNVDEILDEYYSGFGRAKNAVKNYFRHWEKVSDAITDKSFNQACRATGGNSWKGFILVADAIFTPEVMKKGRELINAAQKAAQGDSEAEIRIAFLERGLRRAELTLAAQAAFRVYKKGGDAKIFARALDELDSYRRSVDMKDTDSASYTYWYESIYGWNRSITDILKKD